MAVGRHRRFVSSGFCGCIYGWNFVSTWILGRNFDSIGSTCVQSQSHEGETVVVINRNFAPVSALHSKGRYKVNTESAYRQTSLRISRMEATSYMTLLLKRLTTRNLSWEKHSRLTSSFFGVDGRELQSVTFEWSVI